MQLKKKKNLERKNFFFKEKENFVSPTGFEPTDTGVALQRHIKCNACKAGALDHSATEPLHIDMHIFIA